MILTEVSMANVVRDLQGTAMRGSHSTQGVDAAAFSQEAMRIRNASQRQVSEIQMAEKAACDRKSAQHTQSQKKERQSRVDESRMATNLQEEVYKCQRTEQRLQNTELRLSQRVRADTDEASSDDPSRSNSVLEGELRFAQRAERELQHIEYNLLRQLAASEEYAENTLDELREARRDATRGSSSRGYGHGHGDPSEAETQKVRQADKVEVLSLIHISEPTRPY